MPNIINDVKLDFKDVLLRPKRSTLRSRNDVDLYREITFRNSGQTYKGVPVMASNMDTVGTFEMAKELSKHGLFTCINKYYTIDEWKKFAAEHPECLDQMAATSGIADFERLTEVLNTVKDIKFICLDVANGYSQHFVEYVRKVRAAFPTHTIIAGDVVSGEMVEELILAGADIVKVGIGPGSVCTTRIKTGVGYPQLSAVIECADAAHGLKGHIISDGGCTCPGDVAKAFGAGADFVMVGGMFAGHDQSGGNVVTTADGRKVKLFYGTSSATAMQKHLGGVADYKTSEGKTVEVEYRGDVCVTVKDILGGLRSACTYVGAAHLRELPRRATFIRCSRQVDLYREITFRNSGQTYKGVPVMASNMDTVGTFEMAKELSKHGLFTCIHKYYTIDEWKKFAADHPACLEQMAASSGTAEADFERLTEILNNVKELKFICLDVANGYSQHFVEYVRKVRAAFPTHTIIAGNVVTGEMVEELILSGADIIKVGIGPGSVCTTRIKTGVGYPQLSAVIECADAAHGLKGHIISDGGCTCPGDVAKAFGAGADFVMAGGMFAGHDQCGGDVVTTADGRKVKLFYGMSSSTAMQKHSGGIAEYRSSEGKTVEVEYRGDVGVTVKDILGGLRSACTYVGAAHLRELPRRATFIRCCRQVNDTFS